MPQLMCALLCWWQDEMCNYPLFPLIPSAASFPAFCSPLLHLLVSWSAWFSCPLRCNPAQFRLTYLKAIWGRESMKTYLKMIEGQQECVVAFAETQTHISCWLAISDRLRLLFRILVLYATFFSVLTDGKMCCYLLVGLMNFIVISLPCPDVMHHCIKVFIDSTHSWK